MRHVIVAVFAALTLLAVSPAAWAQTAAQTAPQSASTPSPEALAAAHELMAVMKPADQFKAILPVLIQNLKQAVVQGRPEMEKQYDAMMPVFNESAQKRVNELIDTIAVIYASNFTADELRDVIAFYRTPTGQKFLARQPTIAQQSMAAGQELGRAVMGDVQQQMNGHAN
ncbi:MAG TPA: DUF2059 domain-containing protein [Xanthobacteraceae bacterium]|jgi:hypothetical protein|nr:DUF2059 domain-containing protein [Xanthobacteraceae bacterium]